MIKNNHIFFSFVLPRSWTSLSAIVLSACGGSKSSELNQSITVGFSNDYSPPEANFVEPNIVDPYFKKLEPSLVEPYWTSALEMNNANRVIDEILNNQRLIKFSFPEQPPSYLPITILGWVPANQQMIAASKEIFSQLEKVLNIELEQVDTVNGINNVVISQSIQGETSGFSYFPNTYYELGSDIFISKDYSNPSTFPNGLTNYDYEVLLHEIGHALGLKHPFEADSVNTTILNDYEDQTKFTAMSYNNNSDTFDGTYRPLDWMTLTKLYGVASTFNSDNNEYSFNDLTGTFIIDANGIDIINASTSMSDIYLDLRSGMQSYEGQKSNFVTAANQLTISHGSDIENITTGFGDDTIVGNHLSNLIISGSGHDAIFGGEGSDIIYPGSGQDAVDLSEAVQAQDRLVIERANGHENFVTVYGFSQGISGDILDISDFEFSTLTVLPIVNFSNVPFGYIDNCILTVFGLGLNSEKSVQTYFGNSDNLGKFKLSSEKNALMITSNSQNTGENQNIYSLSEDLGSIEVQHLAQIVGNYLDIDNWSINNFLV